jgi:hypothetical protein
MAATGAATPGQHQVDLITQQNHQLFSRFSDCCVSFFEND